EWESVSDSERQTREAMPCHPASKPLSGFLEYEERRPHNPPITRHVLECAHATLDRYAGINDHPFDFAWRLRLDRIRRKLAHQVGLIELPMVEIRLSADRLRPRR